jgi:hypothetical protein
MLRSRCSQILSFGRDGAIVMWRPAALECLQCSALRRCLVRAALKPDYYTPATFISTGDAKTEHVMT